MLTDTFKRSASHGDQDRNTTEGGVAKDAGLATQIQKMEKALMSRVNGWPLSFPSIDNEQEYPKRKAKSEAAYVTYRPSTVTL
jgi:hypothetical protein